MYEVIRLIGKNTNAEKCFVLLGGVKHFLVVAGLYIGGAPVKVSGVGRSINSFVVNLTPEAGRNPYRHFYFTAYHVEKQEERSGHDVFLTQAVPTTTPDRITYKLTFPEIPKSHPADEKFLIIH